MEGFPSESWSPLELFSSFSQLSHLLNSKERGVTYPTGKSGYKNWAYVAQPHPHVFLWFAVYRMYVLQSAWCHEANLVVEALLLEKLEGLQLSAANYDWQCQPHSEVEYWEVYYCLGIKLYSPVSVLSVVKLIILFPPALPTVYLRTYIG